MSRLNYFGIFNGEDTLFTKSAKKMVKFQKKITLFFSIMGGSVPVVEFSIIFSFYNPSLKILANIFEGMYTFKVALI